MKKVFCIGPNKTGTTSLAALFRSEGYRIGDQAKGELLFAEAYATGNWQAIIDFAKSADFFQDLPFSAQHTYQHLYPHYPDALYLLSTRSSAEAWYASLTAFHSEKFGVEGSLPDKNALQRASYRFEGFAWLANRLLYNSPEHEPYRKADLLQWYACHLEQARRFFADKAAQFLEIDIAAPDAAAQLAVFANFRKERALPHLNRKPI